MRIPKNTNPALVTTDDKTRWALEFVALQKGHLIATDGRMLLCMRAIREDGDPDEALIHKNTIEFALNLAKPYGQDVALNLSETEVEVPHPHTAIRTVFPVDAEGASYPHWEDVIPDVGNRMTLHLNAERLMKLATALAAKDGAIIIHFDPNNPSAEVVVTTDMKDRFAVLMPMRAGESAGLDRNEAYQHALDERAAYRVAQEEKGKLHRGKA